MLNSDVDKLSSQALMAAVSIGIHRDITSLGDTLLRTKRLGLRNASSRIDVSSLRPLIRADLPSPPRTNFSNTGTSVNRIYSNIEVQNRTLKGSEPNIDCTFEGGNLKLSLIQIDNAFEVRIQNLYGFESSIDCSYGRENPRPLMLWVYRIELLKFIIIRTMDQTQILIKMKEGSAELLKALG